MSEIQLYLGDCLYVLPTIPDNSVNMVLCDLPYGVTAMGWDCKIPLDLLWNQYKRIIKDDGNIVLFSSGLFTVDLINSNRDRYKYKLIWNKNVPTGMLSAKYRPMKYYEEICIFGNSDAIYNPQMKSRVGKHKECYNYDHYCGDSNHIKLDKKKKRYDPNFVQPSDVLNFNIVPNRSGKLHPTQKPVELLEYLIKTYSNEGDTVLDNCMGSGSTGLACKNTGRNFIGIEINKDYFNIAKQRIESGLVVGEQNKKELEKYSNLW